MDAKDYVSVVIVNYNGERFADDCIRSVLRSTYPNLEVIVVDNDSIDQSRKELEKFRGDPRVKLIFLKSNLHYAGGNNVGIRSSKGEYLLFLNIDTILEPYCIEELVKKFKYDVRIAAVQCLLLRMKEKTIDSIGGTIDFCCRLLPASLLWAHNTEARKERRLFWGSGAALAVRRRVLDEIGWFDTEMPTDEVDLCWRINLAGGKILLSTNSVVQHFGAGSFGKARTKERMYMGELARLLCVLKNYEIGNLVKLAPYMIAYLLMTIGWDMFFYRRMDMLLFRLKAYVHVIKSFRDISLKRSKVQLVRKLSDAKVMELAVRPNPVYYLVR